MIGGGRVRLAIVANAPAPYRLAMHARLVRELPGVELTSIFKHEFNNSPWEQSLPAEIGPVVLGRGESMTDKNRGLNALRQWGRGGEIIAVLRERGADAVIVTGFNDLGLMRVIRWCRGRRVPCFMFSDSNVFGDRARGPARVVKGVYVPWIVRSLSGLMPCGRRGVEYYARYGGEALPAFYVPHEPNYAAVASATAERVAEARARHGLRADLRYINYCARMAPVKRPDLLVDAFARIAGERRGWGVVFVGGGELLEATRARVPESLRDRVVFTGFVDGAERIAALYRCCEVHVLPSAYEPWAAVIPEAACAGLPIVASHVVGAAAEVIEEDVNGYTFRAGDAEDLARTLLRATDDAVLPRLRAGVPGAFARWRERCDPVDGVRRALEHAGLLPPACGVRPSGDPATDWQADVRAGVNASSRSGGGRA